MPHKEKKTARDSHQKALGHQLRRARLAHHITQEDVATRAGISVRALQQLEAGAGSTLATCLQVLEALGRLSIFDALISAADVSPTQPPPKRAPRKDTQAPIRIADYPQLRLIAWNRKPDTILDPQQALALYERNWRHVETESLKPEEKKLIERLVKTIGRGVLHV